MIRFIQILMKPGEFFGCHPLQHVFAIALCKDNTLCFIFFSVSFHHHVTHITHPQKTHRKLLRAPMVLETVEATKEAKLGIVHLVVLELGNF